MVAQNLAVGDNFMLFLLLLFPIGRYGADFWPLTGSFCGKMGQGVYVLTMISEY